MEPRRTKLTDFAASGPSNAGVKLSPEFLESCYTPIIQSGGKFDLKPSAFSNAESLFYGTITCSLGARYKSYCSNVGRTYIINPSKSQEKHYKLLLELQQAAIDAMRPDAKLSAVYAAVQNRLKSKAPALEGNLTKNVGFATGLEFREYATTTAPRRLLLQPDPSMPRPWHGRSDARSDPAVLCLRLRRTEPATHKPPPRTRTGAPSSSTPSRRCRCAPAWSSTWPSASTASRTRTRPTCAAPPSLPSSFRGAAQILPGPSPPAAACPRPYTCQVRGRKYALFLADTLLVKEEGTAEVLTDRAPKAWGDISCAAPLALSHHIGARSTFLRMAEQSRATRRVVASSAVSSPLGCCRRWPLTRPSFAPPAPPWNPPGTT